MATPAPMQAALKRALPKQDRIARTGAGVTIAIPVCLKRRGGARVIEGPDGAAAYAAADRNRPLIDTLVRAHRWRAALERGEAASLEDLARREGATEGTIRRGLGLAFLAPEIAAAILAGRQPPHLTAERLLRARLPLSWAAQRRNLGVTG